MRKKIDEDDEDNSHCVHPRQTRHAIYYIHIYIYNKIKHNNMWGEVGIHLAQPTENIQRNLRRSYLIGFIPMYLTLNISSSTTWDDYACLPLSLHLISRPFHERMTGSHGVADQHFCFFVDFVLYIHRPHMHINPYKKLQS